MGVSETMTFMVALDFLSLLSIFVVVAIVMVVICAGMFWFLRKRRHSKPLQTG
jgi:Flp pilus assembly protein TadB